MKIVSCIKNDKSNKYLQEYTQVIRSDICHFGHTSIHLVEGKIGIHHRNTRVPQHHAQITEAS